MPIQVMYATVAPASFGISTYPLRRGNADGTPVFNAVDCGASNSSSTLISSGAIDSTTPITRPDNRSIGVVMTASRYTSRRRRRCRSRRATRCHVERTVFEELCHPTRNIVERWLGQIIRDKSRKVRKMRADQQGDLRIPSLFNKRL